MRVHGVVSLFCENHQFTHLAVEMETKQCKLLHPYPIYYSPFRADDTNLSIMYVMSILIYEGAFFSRACEPTAYIQSDLDFFLILVRILRFLVKQTI